jgi:hypothetical protein
MRSVHRLLVRAAALCFALSGAALLAAPGCGIANVINSGTDCNDSCKILTACGVLHTGDCGLYCAGLVTGAVTAGCDDQFAAQNTCAKNNGQCDSPASEAACAPQVMAFASCMKSYCTTNPSADGCASFVSGDGGAGGGGAGGGSVDGG